MLAQALLSPGQAMYSACAAPTPYVLNASGHYIYYIAARIVFVEIR